MARRSVSPFVAWRWIHRGLAACVAITTAGACGLAVDDLFTRGAGGPGAGGAGGAVMSSSSRTSSPASASSGGSSSASSSAASSASSAAASTALSAAASSSGGLVCGDGVCSPGESAVFCPQDCGPGATTSSGGTGGGVGGTGGGAGVGGADGGPACDHAPCDTGGPMSGACDPCAAMVCASDAYCCTTAWDAQCVTEAGGKCGACCGNGTCNQGEDCKSCPAACGACPPVAACAHDACVAGAALAPTKCHDPCVAAVCAQKPACCGNGSWNASCEVLAAQLCGADPCVTAVCGATPACCTSGWTQACVDAAKTACPTPCNCAHGICDPGGALSAGCSPCAKAVCQADAYCCATAWDGTCKGEVGSVCGIVCP